MKAEAVWRLSLHLLCVFIPSSGSYRRSICLMPCWHIWLGMQTLYWACQPVTGTALQRCSPGTLHLSAFNVNNRRWDGEGGSWWIMWLRLFQSRRMTWDEFSHFYPLSHLLIALIKVSNCSGFAQLFVSIAHARVILCRAIICISLILSLLVLFCSLSPSLSMCP